VKPFRFGVNARTLASAADWIALARKVEGLGFSTLNLPDHLAELPAPLPALAAAAVATTRLRVGTMVLNNDFRHPVLLAREAATLDVVSGGRFELGLGAGYMKAEYEQAGLRFDRGGVRVERLAEAVAIVKQLFEGKPVTFIGRHYQVTDHVIHPRPVQRPRPPIVIGANRPQLLTLAAGEADIVGLTGVTFPQGGVGRDLSGFGATGVDERVRLVREAVAASDGNAGFLAWGDPTLYDGLIGVLREAGFGVRVVPGISAVSALAARFGVALNRVAGAVLITTGRRLEAGWPTDADDVVVMLDAGLAFRAYPDAEIFWGAYLGTPDEILRSGVVAEVGAEIERVRDAARRRKGWMFDTYLLRRASPA
jgi:probable F420-dependent oxidoreductase